MNAGTETTLSFDCLDKVLIMLSLVTIRARGVNPK